MMIYGYRWVQPYQICLKNEHDENVDLVDHTDYFDQTKHEPVASVEYAVIVSHSVATSY